MLIRRSLLTFAVSCLVGASSASAEVGMRLDVKAESHNTVMTAPIGGLFLGVGYARGDSDLHPGIWAAAGALVGLESQGLAAEAGGSLTYYGASRSAGFGLTLDAGLGVLWLDQQHDREQLTAIALIVEPAVVFTHARFTFLAGLRAKDVVYEDLEMEEGATTTEVFAWKPETGVKLGMRVAF